jgi:hypothetical protein
MLLLAAVAIAACGPRAAPEQADADSGVAAATTEPLPEAAPVPAPTYVDSASGTPVPLPEPPTHADSVAAAAQDVTPEWVQNGRKMAGYQVCMSQAASLPPEVKGRVEAGCRQRSGAPR